MTSTKSRPIDRLLQKLDEKDSTVKEMGGSEKIEKQRSRGKLTARERIARLLGSRLQAAA